MESVRSCLAANSWQVGRALLLPVQRGSWNTWEVWELLVCSRGCVMMAVGWLETMCPAPGSPLHSLCPVQPFCWRRERSWSWGRGAKEHRERACSSWNRLEFPASPNLTCIKSEQVPKCTSCWWFLPLLWAWNGFVCQELNVLFSSCAPHAWSQVFSMSLSCSSDRTAPLINLPILCGENRVYCQALVLKRSGEWEETTAMYSPIRSFTLFFFGYTYVHETSVQSMKCC